MKQTIFDFQGYCMRSHSERRWAGMMDALGISWVYEPGLVKTRHGMYLPDFYLPQAGIYLEVKGPKPKQIEIDKAHDVQAATGIRVVFAYGDMHVEREHGVQGAFFLTPGNCRDEAGRSNDATFSTYELGPVIKEGLGNKAWGRYMRAGMKLDTRGPESLADIVRDMLVGPMDRSTQENLLSRRHKAANDQKAQQHTQISRAEWALRAFFARNPAQKEFAQ